MKLRLIALLICAAQYFAAPVCKAQNSALALPPDGPTPKIEALKSKPRADESKKKFFFAHGAMVGASVFTAFSSRYGGARCINEHDARFIPYGPLTPDRQFRSSLKTALIADAAVFSVSYLLHRKHHHQLSLILPIAAATSQISIGAMQYSAGCF